MASRSPSQLWKPGTSIRFSPKRPAKKLYPDLGNSKTSEASICISTQDTARAPQSKAATEAQAASANLEEPSPSASVINDVSTWRKPVTTPAGLKFKPSNWSFLAPGQAPENGLEFELSKARFVAAKKAVVNTDNSYWSHLLYERANADGSVHNVKVHYCTSKHTMENVCERYFQNEPVLGFDMEWMAYANRNSGPRQNVSLIQIASPSRIALFHTALFSKDDFVSSTFKKLMEDSNVIKAGVNILADATRLRKVLGVEMAGVLEVSHLYNLVRCCRTRQPGAIPKSAVTMGRQVEECLGLPLYKEDSIRAGNWMSPLDSRQLQYAAADAYAGLQLYHVLEKHRLQLDPKPPRPHFAELRRPLTRPVEEIAESSSEEDFIDESITDEDFMALEEAMITEELLPNVSVSARKAEDVKARDSRLSAADLSVESFKALATKRTARTAALRAYYVWHNNKDLTPEAVASLLRNPPLRTNTVVTYILDAVTAENLPYSKARMADEVLSVVHPSAVSSRYQSLAQKCNFTPMT